MVPLQENPETVPANAYLAALMGELAATLNAKVRLAAQLLAAQHEIGELKRQIAALVPDVRQ